MLASLRWVPVLMWNHQADELVPPAAFLRAADALAANGYRYELDVFQLGPPLPPTPVPNHITLAANDEFGPAATFLDAERVVRDPPRVTYVVTRISTPRDADGGRPRLLGLADPRRRPVPAGARGRALAGLRARRPARDRDDRSPAR
jgi:hypothetical protein